MDSMSSSCKSRQLSPVPVGTCPPISKASSQGTRSEEYMNAIRQKRRAIEMLNIENEIFRQFSARTMPLMEPSELSFSEATARHQTLRRQSKSFVLERHRTITAQQKCHILFSQRELLKSEMKAFMDKCEVILQNYRAVLTTNAIRMDELRKAKGEFEAIMSEGVTSFMPVHKAESFLRYQSRALANRNNLIHALRIKSSLLRGEIREIRRNIRLTEIDDSRPNKIDFKVLQQSNALFLEHLQAKNIALVRTKKFGSELATKLRIYKAQLTRLTIENEKFTTRLQSDQNRTQPYSEEMNKVLCQCEEENMKCLRLLQLADDYRVPEVTCFIQNVIKEQTLERKQAIWNQRRRMAEVMYKRQRSLLSKIWTEKEKQAQLTSKCQ
ncbi:unnamed protein product [Dicrocoelium dendriticum]|nr:unnamed protein product [Dicrocoelium dendriticum]